MWMIKPIYLKLKTLYRVIQSETTCNPLSKNIIQWKSQEKEKKVLIMSQCKELSYLLHKITLTPILSHMLKMPWLNSL